MSLLEYDEERERKLLQKSYIEEGRAEGRAEGRKEGILYALTDLVRKGLLSLRDAAGQAGMNEEEFAERMLRFERNH